MVAHFFESEFIIFILVGVVNTLFGYSVFAVLLYCKLHYVVACLLTTCVGVIFNFKTTGSMVFKQTENQLIWRFVLVYTVIYFLGIALIKFCTYFIGNIYIIGLLTIPFTSLAAYYLNKYFVFRRISYDAH